MRPECVLDDWRRCRRAGREVLRLTVDVRPLVVVRVAEDSAAENVKIARTQKAILPVDEFVEIIGHVGRPLILSVVLGGKGTDG